MSLLQPAAIIYPGQIDSTVREADPNSYDRRVLAEGDSWFSFGSWKFHSLLSEMKFQLPTAVVTLAQPGDTMRRMSDMTHNRHFESWLSERYAGMRFEALLMSGGGNDLIEDSARVIPPRDTAPAPDLPPQAYIDTAELTSSMQRIEGAYARVVSLRDLPGSSCRGVPLVTHAYDFATPRNAPARFLVVTSGPWLYPAMVAAKIPPARWNEVSDLIIGALGRTLHGLETRLPNFHVAATQGKLVRAAAGARGDSHDWANEIHPNGGGFRKLAPLLSERLEAVL